MKQASIEFPNCSDVLTVGSSHIQLVNITMPEGGSYGAQMQEAVEGLEDADFETAGLRANTASTFKHPIKRRLRAAQLVAGALSDAPLASYRVFQSGDDGYYRPRHVVGVSNVARHSGSVKSTSKYERVKAQVGMHHRDLGVRALTGFINEHTAQAPTIPMAEAIFEETIRLATDANVKELRVSKMETPEVEGLTVIEHVVDLSAVGFRRIEEAAPLVINGVAYPGEDWVLHINR